MKLCRPLLTLLIALVLLGNNALSIQQYRPSYNNQNASSSATGNNDFKTLQITDWIGERFIFLGRHPKFQRYGYQLIYPASHVIGSLPYQDYVEKVVKITNVTPSSTRVPESYTVEMTVEQTGERLRAMAVGGNVRGLAPFADIERARELFVGKTLWRSAGSIQTLNEQSGEVSFLPVDPSEPLTVTAVKAGWEDDAPIRFMVRTSSGANGFIDVNLSGTNISQTLRNAHRFENEFQLLAPSRESAAEASKSYKPSDAALSRAAQGKDVFGWQQGWWGMTTDEMIQVFGGPLQKLPKRDIYKGMYAEYSIANYKVDGDLYTVIFQMDNRTRRLAQVLIRSEEYNNNSPYLRSFDQLEELLSQKYGPVRYKQDENADIVKRERQWVFPTTTIELNYLFIRGISSGVTIRYYPTASSDAGKL